MTPDALAEALPRLSFFAIAAETPVVILDGIVFYLVDQPNAGKCYFVCEGDRYALARAQSLADIERQYLSLFARVLDQYKARYLCQVVDKRIQTAQEMKRKLAESNVVAFLATQLIPKLVELDGGQAQFDEQRQMRRDQAVRTLLAVKAEPLPKAGSILEQSVGANAVIFDEKIYPLVRIVAPGQGADLIVRAGGAFFGLSPRCRLLAEVEATFRTARLPEFLERQALAEAPDRTRILREIELQELEMAEYLQGVVGTSSQTGDRCLYQNKEWGILKQGGVFYVYVQVPEYVIEDKDGSLYRFDATRVGVPVTSCAADQVLVSGRAVMLTPYEHMFVASVAIGASICMPKGDAYFAALQRMPLREALCAYLKDAKETLRAGHHAGNPNSPYHRIKSFSYRRITRQEANEKRLPIFPFYRGSGAVSFTPPDDDD